VKGQAYNLQNISWGTSGTGFNNGCGSSVFVVKDEGYWLVSWQD